jgi:transcriptional regulator with XRE-family HTH domain
MTYTAYRATTEEAKRLRKAGGQYIRGLRQRAGMSQLDLANALGLTYYTFVSQVENGAARVPPEALGKWAQALRVPSREFAIELLSYYDPYTYQAIFGDEAPRKGTGDPAAAR